jgi:hypothetical protein
VLLDRHSGMQAGSSDMPTTSRKKVLDQADVEAGTTSSTVGQGVSPSCRAAPNSVPIECPPGEAGYVGKVQLFATALGEARALHGFVYSSRGSVCRLYRTPASVPMRRACCRRADCAQQSLNTLVLADDQRCSTVEVACEQARVQTE